MVECRLGARYLVLWGWVWIWSAALVGLSWVSSVSHLWVIASISGGRAFSNVVPTIAPHLWPTYISVVWLWPHLGPLRSAYWQYQGVLVCLLEVLILVEIISHLEVFRILHTLALLRRSCIVVDLVTAVLNAVMLAPALINSGERPRISIGRPELLVMSLLWIRLWALLAILIIYHHLWLWLSLISFLLHVLRRVAIVVLVFVLEVSWRFWNRSVLILLVGCFLLVLSHRV